MESYISITAVTAKTFNSTEEIATEAKAEIETHPLRAKQKIRKCLK